MFAIRFTARQSLPALLALVALLLTITLAACGDPVATPTPIAPTATATTAATDTPIPPTNTPEPTATPTIEPTATTAAIPEAERGFVPVLCYHHIRDWVASDTEDDRAYIVPPSKLDEQLAWLKENGYTSVTSEQVYDYKVNGKPLPPKPIMLSFDDNDDNQFTQARPILQKHGMNATFFIMTVTVDKENYMTSEQIKQLDKEGFDIQPHTWDHHMVTGYKGDDWTIQLEQPKKFLEDLLGHPTPFFAYPFGIYNAEAAQKLEELGYKGAFRLVEEMDNTVKPAYAIKRYIANGYWTLDQFQLVVEGGWE